MFGETSTGGKKRPQSQRESNSNERAKTSQKKRRTTDNGKELDSYLQVFPLFPEGTVKTWKQCADVADSVKTELRELCNCRNKTTKEKAQKAIDVISKMRSDIRIKNIEMDLDWSEIENFYPELKNNPFCLTPVMTEFFNRDVNERIGRRARKLEEISNQLKAMSKHSNKNEMKTYETATEKQEDDCASLDEVKKAMAGVKIPSPLKDEMALNEAMNMENLGGRSKARVTLTT